MQIRKTTKTDVAELSNMMVASWRDAYADILPLEKNEEICSVWLTEDKFLERLANSTAVNLLTTKNGRIVGHLFGEFSDDTNFHLAYLYVAVGYQRQGIGTRFLARLKKEVPTAKSISLGVFSDNQKAIEFYRAHGFEVVGEDNPSNWKLGEPTGKKMLLVNK